MDAPSGRKDGNNQEGTTLVGQCVHSNTHVNRQYEDIVKTNMDTAIIALKKQQEAARVLRVYKFASSDSHMRTHMYSQHMHGADG